MNTNLTLSKYTIFSRLKDSQDYFLINLLSGSADILEPDKATEILENRFTGIEEYVEKGYLVDEKEEEKRYKLKYLEFLENREQDEVQVFFVPRYSCNFACSYCYQAEYQPETQSLRKEIVDAFYRYVDERLSDRRKYITIFGGEPLLNDEKSREEMEWLLSGATERGLDVAIVTNGYNLKEYLDILSRASIREIQITLDGTQSTHDSRRFLANGTPTFHKIVEGIDAALERNTPINLRIVVDKDNIDNLKDLASFAIDKGWTKNSRFKTQIGRNYELHTCGYNVERLFTRAGLYEKIYEIIKEYPRFLEFHKPAFSISRFIFENGECPVPLFDSCPGTKTEWAFDYTGKIYACTATVGKAGEELGTYYPEVTNKEEIIDIWENRDITSIPQCRTCTFQLACGGGCAAVAKNQTGSIMAPDCRPVKELMEMGLSLYSQFYKEVEHE